MNLPDIASLERELTHFNMVRHQRQYSFPFGTKSRNGVTIAGSCGHLFIGDGSNKWISQLDGALDVLPKGEAPWVDLFQMRVRQAESMSVKILNLVVPEKQTILYNFYGFEMSPLSWINRPAIRITQNLSSELGVIYPVEAMRRRQGWAELYWRGNSHWCASGCITAVEIILEKFMLECDVNEIALMRRASKHDLLHHLLDEVDEEEVLCISINGTLSEEERPYENTGSHTGSQYVIRNPAAPVDSTLVIFGDSYSYDAGLAYALSAYFSQVRFLWSKDVIWDYVRENNAEYVLWQSAERFLSSIPAS